MEKIKKFIISEILIFKLMIKSSPIKSFINIFITIILQFMPLGSLLLYEKLLNNFAVYENGNVNNIDSILCYTTIYLIIQLLLVILGNINGYISNKIKYNLSHSINLKIMDKISNLQFDYLENQENLNAINSAANSETYITSNSCWLISTFIRIFSFIINLIVLLKYDYFLLLIYVIFITPGIFISWKCEKEMDEFSISNLPQYRKKDYYKSILTEGLYAKELRVYNLSSFFKNKYFSIWNELKNERNKIFNKGYLKGLISIFCKSIGYIIIFSLLMYKFIYNNLLIGTFILLLQLVISTGDRFYYLIYDMQTQAELVIPRIQHFIYFLNEKEIEKKGIKLNDENIKIEFKNVYFKYPNSDNFVLENISFCINKKEKIALIGANGSGKSTIIKLLLRFYKPTSGDILINDVNIHDVDIRELYSKISVCFQDVSKFALSLRENISLGDIDRKNETKEITKCIEEFSLNEIISNYNYEHLDEINLTKKFDENGIELSGGQWQKVSISRAFFRKSNFIILDEPSSALDPIAENKIFESLKKLCYDKGGIIISHRLSTINMVDRIIVLDQGKIIETGKHNELMKNKNLYYKMYKIQADKYKMEGEYEKYII